MNPSDTAGKDCPTSAGRKLSITEKLLMMAEEMPTEVRANMPPDLAEQHDHYIYGSPKK